MRVLMIRQTAADSRLSNKRLNCQRRTADVILRKTALTADFAIGLKSTASFENVALRQRNSEPPATPRGFARLAFQNRLALARRG